MHPERRTSYREVLHMPIVELQSDKCETGMIINLSQKGLCYYKPFSELKENGSEILLSFTTQDTSTTVNVSGKVQHQHILSENIVTGITFNNLSDDARLAIRNQVDRFV